MNNTSDDRLLKAAEFYFNLGFEVFPAWTRVTCKDGRYIKEFIPSLRWKVKTFTFTAFREILRSGNYNTICIKTGAPSDLFVLDLDNKNGISGIDSLKALDIRIPEYTPCVKTPNNGFHYYFKYHHSLNRYSTGSDSKKAIDMRGNGGIIFAPPTSFPGAEYTFLNPIRMAGSNLKHPPQELLEWILSHKKNALLTPPHEHGNKSIDEVSERQRQHFLKCVRDSKNAKQGARSEIDYSTMSFARKIGLSKEEIQKHLKDIGKFRGRPDYFERTYNKAIIGFKNRGKS